MTFGSLFTGIGGIDFGLERAGLTCSWQVENNLNAVRHLRRKWPRVSRHNDVTALDFSEMKNVDLICGGDPCPSRSRPSVIHGTSQRDMWPEFRAAVRAMRPTWVLRENVVSPDVENVAADLAAIGYLCVVLECDGSKVTGQHRSREYLCGVLESIGICPVALFKQASYRRDSEQNPEEEVIASCITTSRKRYDARDNYVLENGSGIRILDHHERERLQGFDAGWTDGLPTRDRLIGNAAIPAFSEWIGRSIINFSGTRNER